MKNSTSFSTRNDIFLQKNYLLPRLSCTRKVGNKTLEVHFMLFGGYFVTISKLYIFGLHDQRHADVQPRPVPRIACRRCRGA